MKTPPHFKKKITNSVLFMVQSSTVSLAGSKLPHMTSAVVPTLLLSSAEACIENRRISKICYMILVCVYAQSKISVSLLAPAKCPVPLGIEPELDSAVHSSCSAPSLPSVYGSKQWGAGIGQER